MTLKTIKPIYTYHNYHGNSMEKKVAANNLGIPSTWLDENASDPIYANRYYSRENGWETHL